MARQFITACRLLPPFAAIAAAAAVATIASATDRTWTTTASTGSFDTTTNWTPNGLPNSADKLTFRRGAMANYSVTFPGKNNFPFPVYEMNQLRVGSNTVTFSDALMGIQGPGTVNVTNTTTANSARGVVVGVVDTDTDAVLTTSLAHLNAVAATVGDVPNSRATLNVIGGAFTVTGSSAADDELIVGNQGHGELRISGGAHVDVSGAQGNVVVAKFGYDGIFEPRGLINVAGSGSQLNVAGRLDVGVNGYSTVDVSIGGALTSALAVINGTTGSDVGIRGVGSTWTNADDIVVGGGATSPSGFGASLHVTGGAALSVGGTLSVEPAAFFYGNSGTVTGYMANDGFATIRGAGLVLPIYGTFHVIGDYSQNGRLELGLGDPAHYDRFHVDGDMFLGPSPSSPRLVVVADSFLHAGDSFDILDWDGALIGTFAGGVTLPSLPVALLWDASRLYTTGVINVVYRFTADFNEDGNVNDLDLAKWKTGFGTPTGATHLQGDADGDQDVDGADLLLWQQQFGSSAVATAVPEPGCASLLVTLGVLMVLADQHGRRP